VFSGKFPKTASQAVHSRQAAHALSRVSGFLESNCLAAHSRPLGDARCFTQFWVSR